jgi:2-polyprenyl-3-methyl-5-hydroxy-6-metoxy-1,4-benzoquinol methylase
MTDDISDIAEFYNKDPQKEHHRLEEHQLEFDLTWRFLDAYLPSQGEILEIGAGTGHYTLGLVQRGYAVTEVDFSEENLKACRAYLAQAGVEDKAQYILGDARYLQNVPEKEYDAVLMMGPLYHLVEESDRQMAVGQALAHLRPGGLIFSAFISRYGCWGHVLKNIPQLIEYREEIRTVLSRGTDSRDWPKGGFRAYYATVAEIAPLHESLGFETLKVVGVEPCISADDESYNKLEGERRKLFLDLFYKISAEPSIVGASSHLLYIGRKIQSDPRP